MPFIGRIDTAQLKELNDGSRVWVINARDWLSVLADNLIDRGKWWSSSPGRGTTTIMTRGSRITSGTTTTGWGKGRVP
jgi:hypothetical protein